MINLKIKENKNRIFLILLVLFLISGWFYWFQFRPAQIKHDCSWVQIEDGSGRWRPAIERMSSQITEYEFCLHDKGL